MAYIYDIIPPIIMRERRRKSPGFHIVPALVSLVTISGILLGSLSVYAQEGNVVDGVIQDVTGAEGSSIPGEDTVVDEPMNEDISPPEPAASEGGEPRPDIAGREISEDLSKDITEGVTGDETTDEEGNQIVIEGSEEESLDRERTGIEFPTSTDLTLQPDSGQASSPQEPEGSSEPRTAPQTEEIDSDSTPEEMPVDELLQEVFENLQEEQSQPQEDPLNPQNQSIDFGPESIVSGVLPPSLFPEPENNKVSFRTDIDGDREIYFKYKGQELKITDNQTDDMFPDFDGKYVVWQGLAPGTENYWQVFVYDAENENTAQITNMNYNNMNPRIDDGMIVWQAWPENTPEGNWEIFLASRDKEAFENCKVSLDLARSEPVESVEGDTEGCDYLWLTQRLTENNYHDMFPQISGEWIMWQSYLDNSWQIFTYNIESSETEQITHDQFKNENPRFLIVWEQKDDRVTKTVGYNPTTGEVEDLGIDTSGLPDELPSPPAEETPIMLPQSNTGNREDGDSDVPPEPEPKFLPPDLSSEDLLEGSEPMSSENLLDEGEAALTEDEESGQSIEPDSDSVVPEEFSESFPGNTEPTEQISEEDTSTNSFDQAQDESTQDIEPASGIEEPANTETVIGEQGFEEQVNPDEESIASDGAQNSVSGPVLEPEEQEIQLPIEQPFDSAPLDNTQDKQDESPEETEEVLEDVPPIDEQILQPEGIDSSEVIDEEPSANEVGPVVRGNVVDLRNV